jgi:hypothetical protein
VLDTPSSATPARLQLTLQRCASRPGWQAELVDLGPPRRFESLAELMAWLNTLEQPPALPAPPARGIR